MDSMDTRVSIVGNESNDNEAVLRSIFPEELWLNILDRVSPATKEVLYYSQPYLRRLLAPTSHLFLFSSVWKVFATKMETELMPSYMDYNAGPRGMEYIEPVVEIVQNCRLVCKDWCNEIDSFYENLDRCVSFGRDDLHRKRTGDWIHCNSFEDSETSAEKFLNHFRHTHAATDRNPFLGRRLSLNLVTLLENGGVPESFLQTVLEILRAYGHHIWYLDLSTDNQPPSTLANYSRIQSMLLYTPNLKSLKWDLTQRVIGDYRGRDLTPNEIDQVAFQIEAAPIPRLEHLKQLSLSIPPVISAHKVRVNSHVEVIKCNHLISWEQLTLPNLKKLCIPYGTAADIDRLEACGAYNWKLESLRLNIDNKLPFILYESVLSVVDIWKDTLVSVDLSPPAARTLAEVEAAFGSLRGARIDLPKLKTFKIALSNRPGVEYIFPAVYENEDYAHISWKAHEAIQMYMDETREIVQVQTINFVWEADKKSRLFGLDGWKTFPKLGSVKGVVPPFQNRSFF